MVILRTEGEKSQYKREKKYEAALEKYNIEEAKKVDEQLQRASFSSLGEAESYYNSIPEDIRKNIKITPRDIHAKELVKYEQKIKSIQDDIDDYKERESKYKKQGKDDRRWKYDAKGDAKKDELKVIKEYYNKVKSEGNYYDFGKIKNYASDVYKYEYKKTYAKNLQRTKEPKPESITHVKSRMEELTEALAKPEPKPAFGFLSKPSAISPAPTTTRMSELTGALAKEKERPKFKFIGEAPAISPAPKMELFKPKEKPMLGPKRPMLGPKRPVKEAEKPKFSQFLARKEAVEKDRIVDVKSFMAPLEGTRIKGVGVVPEWAKPTKKPKVIDVTSNKKDIAHVKLMMQDSKKFSEYQTGVRELIREKDKTITPEGIVTTETFKLALTPKEKEKREKEVAKFSKKSSELILDAPSEELYKTKLFKTEELYKVADKKPTKYEKDQLRALADFERTMDLQAEVTKDIDEFNKLSLTEQDPKLEKDLNKRLENVQTRFNLNPYVEVSNGDYKFKDAPVRNGAPAITFETSKTGISTIERPSDLNLKTMEFKEAFLAKPGQYVLTKEGKETISSKIGRVGGQLYTAADIPLIGALPGGLEMEKPVTEAFKVEGLKPIEAEALSKAAVTIPAFLTGGKAAGWAAGKVGQVTGKIGLGTGVVGKAGLDVAKVGLGAAGVIGVGVAGKGIIEETQKGYEAGGLRAAGIVGGAELAKTAAEFKAFSDIVKGWQTGRKAGLVSKAGEFEAGKGFKTTVTDITTKTKFTDIKPGAAKTEIKFKGYGKTPIIGKKVKFVGEGTEVVTPSKLKLKKIADIKTPEIPAAKGKGKIEITVKGEKPSIYETVRMTVKKPTDEEFLTKTLMGKPGEKPILAYARTKPVPSKPGEYRGYEVAVEKGKVREIGKARTILEKPIIKDRYRQYEWGEPTIVSKYEVIGKTTRIAEIPKIIKPKSSIIKPRRPPLRASKKAQVGIGPDIGPSIGPEIGPRIGEGRLFPEVTPTPKTRVMPYPQSTRVPMGARTPIEVQPIITKEIGTTLAKPFRMEASKIQIGKSGLKFSPNIISQIETGIYSSPLEGLGTSTKMQSMLGITPKEIAIPKTQTKAEIKTAEEVISKEEVGAKEEVKVVEKPMEKVLAKEMLGLSFMPSGFSFGAGISVPKAAPKAPGAPIFGRGMTGYRQPRFTKKGVKIREIKKISKHLGKFLLKK